MNAAKMTFDITKDEYANICDIIDSINVSINSLEEEKNTRLNDIKKIKKVNKIFILQLCLLEIMLIILT